MHIVALGLRESSSSSSWSFSSSSSNYGLQNGLRLIKPIQGELYTMLPQNTLDLKRIWPHKIGWKKPKPPKIMSIIAAIVCHESIIVAADSQITEADQGTYDYFEKIKDVPFGDNTIVIASAGHPAFTDRVIEKTQQLSVGKTINQKDDVCAVIEEAIRQSKSPLDEEQSKFIDQHGAHMICAFYCNSKPQLLIINPFGAGIFESPNKIYCAIGIGGFLANYLFDEHIKECPSNDMAMGTLIFALAKVKKTTRWCGGQTQMRRIACAMHSLAYGDNTVDKSSSVTTSLPIAHEFINVAEKKMLKMDERTKPSRNRKIDRILESAGTEIYLKYMRKSLRNQKKLNAQNAKAKNIVKSFPIKGK
jgi:20S proteasome alpha/beta subunit